MDIQPTRTLQPLCIAATLFLGWILVGCSVQPDRVSSPSAPVTLPRSASPVAPTASLPATATAIPLPAASLPPRPSVTLGVVLPDPTAAFTVSSPLQGISIAELPEILTQAFIQPRPGQDDGHYGVDYAYYHHGEQDSILGTPILSVLSGRVAAVLINRPPFGHAIMVETRLADLPAAWVEQLDLPSRPDPLPVVDRVPCDLSGVTELLALPGESLYVIYAHFNLTPTLQMGASIQAGDVLGEVGNSGYSGNPHLHLEAHVGPAGVAFGSLGFYETITTEQERKNYCLWRMSGVFRVFDARKLFEP